MKTIKHVQAYVVTVSQGPRSKVEMHSLFRPNSAPALHDMLDAEFNRVAALRNQAIQDDNEILADTLLDKAREITTLRRVADLWEGEYIVRVGTAVVGNVGIVPLDLMVKE